MKIRSVKGNNVEVTLTSPNGSPKTKRSTGGKKKQKTDQKNNGNNRKIDTNKPKPDQAKQKKPTKSPRRRQSKQPPSEPKMEIKLGGNRRGKLFPNLGIGVPEIVLDFKTSRKQ